MIDDLLEHGFGAIFRFIKTIIKDILFDFVCYILGWLVLRIITFNQYPNESLQGGIKESGSEETLVSIVGLITITLATYYLTK